MKNTWHAAIFGLAMIMTAWVLGSFWKSSKQTRDYIEVTGKASKDFTSDLIVWKGNFTTKNLILKDAFAKLKLDAEIVKKFLQEKGIPENHVVFNSVNIEREYNNNVTYQGIHRIENSVFAGYRLIQSFSVESPEVDKVEKAAREVSELLETGLEVMGEEPNYFYTKLADLKIQMLAEATKDARNRAEQIAKNAGADLGSLKSADMGIFQITAPNSTEEYSWGGTYNTASKRKTASITVKLEFNSH